MNCLEVFLLFSLFCFGLYEGGMASFGRSSPDFSSFSGFSVKRGAYTVGIRGLIYISLVS